ncbi:transmembrane emp24 domain-containing protein 10 isoform X1 [Phocoena sinus]|uniref:transmembrane emp24 domain-containing protein 10 isoform X1 n=1 Tax=Phocoena sinus TaxID=42100 RepID=UPI0013C3E992|nr:transmembrane emp24 domain-containing protein 10 isoform X1 [Phocoena sinus]
MSGFSGPRAQRGPYPLALLLLLLLGPTSVLAISFHLPVNSRKCLREEIHKDLLVTGAYEITDQSGGAGGLRTHLKITDSAGHILYSKEDATKGKFAFTTEDYDMFEVCFESKGTGRIPDQLVILDMKHGVEAKNYEEIAKVEKLKPLEVELRRLEDLSESIVNDFAYMKKREEEMRDTNGEGREALVSQYVHRKGDRSPNFKFWCTFFSDLPKGVVWKDNCLLPCCCSTGK